MINDGIYTRIRTIKSIIDEHFSEDNENVYKVQDALDDFIEEVSNPETTDEQIQASYENFLTIIQSLDSELYSRISETIQDTENELDELQSQIMGE